MTEAQPQPTNRTNKLDMSVLIALTHAHSYGDEEGFRYGQTIYDQLPTGLSVAEVASIDERVAAIAAKRNKAEHSLRQGKTNALQALRWIGNIAYARNDDISFESVLYHLKHRSGVRSKLAYVALRSNQLAL